jgi:hypothetical protein
MVVRQCTRHRTASTWERDRGNAHLPVRSTIDMMATPKRDMESSLLPVDIDNTVSLRAHAMERYAATRLVLKHQVRYGYRRHYGLGGTPRRQGPTKGKGRRFSPLITACRVADSISISAQQAYLPQNLRKPRSAEMSPIPSMALLANLLRKSDRSLSLDRPT